LLKEVETPDKVFHVERDILLAAPQGGNSREMTFIL